MQRMAAAAAGRVGSDGDSCRCSPGPTASNAISTLFWLLCLLGNGELEQIGYMMTGIFPMSGGLGCSIIPAAEIVKAAWR